MGRRTWSVSAAVLAMVALPACGTSSDDPSTPDPEPYCQVAVQALALGLQQFKATEVAGDVLGSADNLASNVCTNAIANLQAGKPVTFQLLRPTGSPLEVTVNLNELILQPPPGPPPGSSLELQQLWQACWKDFGVSNWMVTACLNGAITPLSAF